MAASPSRQAVGAALAELLDAREDAADCSNMDVQTYWKLLERDARFSSSQASEMPRYAPYKLLQMLQHLLARLDRLNQQRDALSTASDTQRKALKQAETCVGSALAQLIAQWATDSDSDSDDTAPYYAVVVNELVQHCAAGHQHEMHTHVLVASCAHQVFELSDSSAVLAQWPCARCGRLLQLATDSLDDIRVRGIMHSATHVSSVVYRCAPCKFHLCGVCFDGVTAVSSARSVEPDILSLSAIVQVPPAYTTKPPALRVDRFFTLMLPALETLSADYGQIVCQLAAEIRRRVFEVVLHRVSDIAALTELFRELIECPNAALQLIQVPSDSNAGTVAWFPPSVVTWKMAMLSFLGPFFRATTISKELSVRTTEQTDRLRADWGEHYDGGLKTHLVAMMQALLADEQHLLVVDATVSWLATVVTSINKRRLVNVDSADGLDGFLINVSQVVACLVHRLLRRSTDLTVIDPAYHQGFVSIRGFGDKDTPEIRLRKQTQAEKTVATAVEEGRIRQLDRQSVDEFKRRRQSKECTHYYPTMESNYGVRCDLCSTPDFTGPRYKCAFCEDADLCDTCFQVLSAQSAADPRRPGDDVDSRLVNNHKARLVSGTAPTAAVGLVHSLDHVFFRVSVPVPLCNAMHFEWMDFDRSSASYGSVEVAAKESMSIRCADCSCSLDDVDVLYRCSNCFDARFVCSDCLKTEEEHHDPHKFHAPGHVYLSLTRGWRRLYSPLARALHFRSLSFLASLVPRVRSDKASDLFHLAIKCMHLGPFATLQRHLRALREAQELEAFCYCEEERVQYETASASASRDAPRAGRHGGPQHRRRSAKMSSYYNSSKARLKEMMTSRLAMEIQLLSPDNVAQWLLLYASTSRWLLGVASPSSCALQEVLTAPSAAFCAFPEHYFTDLCELVFFLGLHRVDSDQVAVAWSQLRNNQPSDGQTNPAEVIEPLFVLLVQVFLSPVCSMTLRARALKALPSLLAFFSSSSACRSALDDVLERNALLATALTPGLVHFHHEVDVCSGNRHRPGQTSTPDSNDNDEPTEEDRDSPVTQQFEGDILDVRSCVSTVLQYLWQLPVQRATLRRVLEPGKRRSDRMAHCRAEFSALIDAMWTDMTRLVDEAKDKVTALRHLRELLDSSDRGRGLSLPIRPHMMDGYVALHSKQLRLTFYMLIKVLETALWIAQASPSRALLLSQSEAEQGVRALCFALSSVAQAVEAHTWDLSVHVLADGKRVLAHLVYLALLCASDQDSGSQEDEDALAARRELVRSCGASMMNRLGDLDVRIHWSVQSSALERFHQANGDPAVLSSSWSRERFLALLARDGRFDGDRFVQALDVLRQGEDGPEIYEHVDSQSIRGFATLMMDATHMSALREAVEALVADAPEEFQDPLLGSLMADPVRLPSSGKVVDRAVIARHLRSYRGAAGSDPFTRAPLTLSMVSPCPSLARDIQAFVASKLLAFDADTAHSALLVLGFTDPDEDDGVRQSRGVKRSHDVMAAGAGPRV